MSDRCFSALPSGPLPARRDRRPGEAAPRPAICLTPVVSSAQALGALTRAGIPDASAPLVGLVRVCGRRASELRMHLPDVEADLASVDELDFNDPLILGLVVSTTPGLDGGRRAVEGQVRSILVGALRHLR